MSVCPPENNNHAFNQRIVFFQPEQVSSGLKAACSVELFDSRWLPKDRKTKTYRNSLVFARRFTVPQSDSNNAQMSFGSNRIWLRT